MHIGTYAYLCVSVHARACPFLHSLTLFTTVVTALWSVSPAWGPRCAGWVCGSGVIVVSPGSWVLRFKKGESERGIHPSIRTCIQPHSQSKPQTGNRERRERSCRRHRRNRKSPHEYAGNMRVTTVRIYRHSESPVDILLARQEAPLLSSKLAENQRSYNNRKWIERKWCSNVADYKSKHCNQSVSLMDESKRQHG